MISQAEIDDIKKRISDQLIERDLLFDTSTISWTDLIRKYVSDTIDAQQSMGHFNVMILSEEACKKFAEALDNPKPPNEALIRAMKRHEKLIDSDNSN